MQGIEYLRHIVALGDARAAKTAEDMAKTTAYHGFDSFMGLYLELAKMELCMRGEETSPIRVFAVDKALARIDARLDCADFCIPALVRMLKEHRHTPRLNEAIALRIEKSLIGFKYWLDEPGGVHACYFTENHQILYHSAEYFAGQMFPDAVFPSDGKTGAQHRAHATAFLRRWLSWRARFGFSEWLTQGYYMEDILGLICLADEAEERDIRQKCRMLIDLLVFDLAVNGFKGHLPTTHGRVYAPMIIDPDSEECSSVMRLIFDEGHIDGDMSACAVMLACCDYKCPQAVRAAYENKQGVQINRQRMSINVCDAKAFGVDPADFDNIMFFWGMQTYSDRLCIDNSEKVFPTWNWMTNRVKAYKEMYALHDAADAPCQDAPDFTAMTQVDILTRRTPDYIISCAQDFRRGRMGYQQHPWTASLGGHAVVFTTSPASLEYGNRPNRWAGNLCLPRAALHGNVLLCIYRIMPDFVDYLNTHLYFPKHEMDEVIEQNGFIIGRKGDGYIAVTSLLPAYWDEKDPALFKALWPNDWQARYDRADAYEYVAQGHANVWAAEMGSKAENGSFEAFAAGFADARITGDTHHVRYVSGGGSEYTFGWNAPLTADGQEIALHGYPRYDNHACKCGFDTPVYDITAGGHHATLDFSTDTRTDL